MIIVLGCMVMVLMVGMVGVGVGVFVVWVCLGVFCVFLLFFLLCGWWLWLFSSGRLKFWAYLVCLGLVIMLIVWVCSVVRVFIKWLMGRCLFLVRWCILMVIMLLEKNFGVLVKCCVSLVVKVFMLVVCGDSSRVLMVLLWILNSGVFFWDIEWLCGKMGLF